MSKKIILPRNFYPRDYQLDTMKAFFIDGYKNFIDIEHRRAGKDTKWLNIMIAASQLRIGTYVHFFPNFTNAKKNIWNGINKEGKRFLDHFPKELISKINNTELSIKFKNGSVYRMAGADNYDSEMGGNICGIAYSEYPIQNPAAAPYLEPMLAENNGWQAFIYTPRGRNHGHHLYELNRNNPDWYCQKLTVNDTLRNNGEPVIPQSEIDNRRRSGASEEMIQQEYYVSFDASIEGAYFAKAIRMLREQGRICNFAIDPTLPFNTYFDLGINDQTAIWFIQKKPNLEEYDVIHYHESHNQPITYYVNYIMDFRNSNGLMMGKNYSPHDGNKRESDLVKIVDKYRKSGLPMEIVPRISHKIDGIESARGILPKCRFHETNCEAGLGALSSYRSKLNEKSGAWSGPVHDWTSHCADAFMTFSQSARDIKTSNGRILYNRVNTTSIF